MVTQQNSQDSIEAIVLDAIKKRLDKRDVHIDLDTPILSLRSMESIQVLRAVAEIEDRCEVILPDDAVAAAVTIRDLAGLVATMRQESLEAA